MAPFTYCRLLDNVVLMMSLRFLKPNSFRAYFTLMLLLCALTPWASSDADGQVIKDREWSTPLLDDEPFDVLYLDKDSDNVVIKILPQTDTKRPASNKGNLKFEYFEENEFVLEVSWQHVEKYRSFKDLLLEEAEAHVRDKNFPSALRNLLFLFDNGGSNDPELEESLRSVLFRDAAENFRTGDYELALSIFEDLYEKDPTFQVPGVDKTLKEAIELCYDGILQQKFDDGEAEFIKKSLASIKQQYGAEADEFVQGWEKKFVRQAKQILQDARQAAKAGDGRKAHQLSRLAERIEPGLAETREIQVEITEKFPLIVVAVNQPAGDANPIRLDHWGSRRVGRLTQRTLIELTGLSDEGGRYQFLNGRFERTDDFGLQYAFIFDQQQDTMVPRTSANEVASRLLDHADDASPNYIPAWAKILGAVSVDGSDRVSIELRKPFVRPAALARFQYRDRKPDGQPVQDGIYALADSKGDENTFEFNSDFFTKQPDEQHPTLIEKYYRASSDAVDALIRGEVDVVDRPSISDIPKLREAKGIEVRPYAIPTVHFLVPKVRGDYEGSLQLVRALSTAVNREGIINDIFDGADIDGCEALSGPFPIGSDEYDQVSYGYDLKVKSLPYQQKLSVVLGNMAKTTKTKKYPNGRPSDPTIVLAHPAGSLATAACQSIRQSWIEAGIKTTLRALPESVSYPENDNWDVLYVEAAIEEPLTDATRIMGSYGIAKKVSAPVSQSLQSLGYAESWQQASRTLRRIHRQVSNDLSVIPLYQIQEHYAFRKNVYGIGRDLIHLYQNIGRWRIEGYASEPTDAKETNQ